MTSKDNDRVGKRLLARQTRIAAELGRAGFALPGTVLVRTMTCGRQNCRCHADPPRLHGPYFQWTRKVSGKTVTLNLTEEQWERYKEWFDNAKRLRELLAELETLSLEIFEQDS
ncbi:MAG: DUF6788 family protein [Acidimicrobiales bacterium]|jgi:hypothetical protein